MHPKPEFSPFVPSHAANGRDVGTLIRDASDTVDTAVDLDVEQHERDLQVIDRCEQQILQEAAACRDRVRDMRA